MSTYTQEEFGALLRTRYANYVVVGVTGHRDLLPDKEGLIEKAVLAKLNHIKDSENKHILLISAYAQGADQWVAQWASDLPGTIMCLPLAMHSQEYIDDGFVAKVDEGVTTYVEPARSIFVSRLNKPQTLVVELFRQYVGTLTTSERNTQYEQIGKFLTKHCDHLIALWDGVDGGGVGGTSDVVRMMALGKSLSGLKILRKAALQQIHQLVVPRSKNHFPIGRQFNKRGDELPTAGIYEWVITQLPYASPLNQLQKIWNDFRSYPNWYIVGSLLFLGLMLTDVLTGYEHPRDTSVLLMLAGLYGLAAWAYRTWPSARELLLQFAYPLVIALSILLLGTIGFATAKLPAFGDQLFAAANLITLNSSVFETMKLSPISPVLEVARILGGFLAGYAFILAFALATGRENVARLRFYFYRRFSWIFSFRDPNDAFKVVIGNGRMAINVALDLTKSNLNRVVLFAEQLDDAYLPLLRDRKIWLLTGNMTSPQSLEKSYFWRASEVYVVSDSDEENFRCAQEIDDVYVSKKNCNKIAKWFVHLHNLRQRALLQTMVRNPQLRTFNVHENTARRLLLRYPIDRFDETNPNGKATVAQVILVGFGQLSQQIALSCLRLGHYTASNQLHIKVYYPASEQGQVDAFREAHPELFPVHQIKWLFGLVSRNEAVRGYTFNSKFRSIVDFAPLPVAESELIDPAFSLYDYLKPDYAVSIYVCLPTSLESASLLGSVLPRIEWMKLGMSRKRQQTDVQVFCFYNFPDPDEELFIEMKLNSIASYVPVICFGNLIHECTVSAIKNESFNRIARQIGLLYACLYHDNTVLDALPTLRAKLEEWSFYEKKSWNANHNDANVQKTKFFLAKRAELGSRAFDYWADKCWLQLSEIDRWSNIQAADHAWVKLRQMGRKWNQINAQTDLDGYWRDEEIKVLGEVEHRRWNAEKLLLGWLPMPDKDLWKDQKAAFRAQKHHHFLATFDGPDGLPENERNKDFTQVVGLPYFFSTIEST